MDKLRKKRRELFQEGCLLALMPPAIFGLISLAAWIAGDKRTDMLIVLPLFGLFGGTMFFLAALRFYDPPDAEKRPPSPKGQRAR